MSLNFVRPLLLSCLLLACLLIPLAGCGLSPRSAGRGQGQEGMDNPDSFQNAATLTEPEGATP